MRRLALLLVCLAASVHAQRAPDSLLRAIEEGNEARAKTILLQGVPGVATAADGTPIAALAIERNMPLLLKAALAAGASPCSTDKGGRILLALAFQQGSREMVEALLEAGARVRVDYEAVHVVDGKEKRVRRPARGSDGRSAYDLCGTATSALVQTIRNRALLESVESRASVAELRQIVEDGAQVSCQDPLGNTPLILSASGQPEAVRALVALGAKVGEVNQAGEAPLYWAARSGNRECVQALLALGAKPDQAAKNGLTPLHVACLRTSSLVEGEPTAYGDGPPTAEDAAYMARYRPVIEELIAAGAPVNAQDTFGNTPLAIACSLGASDLFPVLFMAKADPNLARKDGRTPLMACASIGRTDMCTALLSAGADLRAADAKGQSAVFYGVKASDEETVSLLASRGASVTRLDAEGKSPMDHAREAKDASMMRLLRSLGAKR